MDDLIYQIQQTVISRMSQSDLSNKSGTEIEKMVKEAIVLFLGAERVDSKGAHAFPDIVIDGTIGVEVKSSKGGMRGLGNSILESTRVRSVKVIYILFVQVGSPNHIHIKRFEDVVTGVAVTHSPRYLIDMAIAQEGSFFKALGMTYDDFRRNDNPAKIVYRYYKSINKDALPYWLDGLSDDLDNSSYSPVIKLIEQEDINALMPLLFIYFPELFSGKNRSKYKKCTLYMMSKHSLVTPHMRDFFSSKGRVTISSPDDSCKCSRVISHLLGSLNQIAMIFKSIDIELVSDAWGTEINSDRLISTWLRLAISNLETQENHEMIIKIFLHHIALTTIYYDELSRQIIAQYTALYR